jgi:DNA-directed RNA polymerase specialized sigma24 family protein
MIDAIVFENMYTANVKSATRYVTGKFPGLDADAIVADAFAKIWRNRENVSTVNLAGLVQTTVYRLAVDTLRTTHLEIESIFSDAPAGENAVSTYRIEPISPSDHNPNVEILAMVTAILTEDQRRVVMMRMDYSFAEIATILATEKGITFATDADLVKATDAAKKLYNRARATMRRQHPERVVA